MGIWWSLSCTFDHEGPKSGSKMTPFLGHRGRSRRPFWPIFVRGSSDLMVILSDLPTKGGSESVSKWVIWTDPEDPEWPILTHFWTTFWTGSHGNSVQKRQKKGVKKWQIYRHFCRVLVDFDILRLSKNRQKWRKTCFFKKKRQKTAKNRKNRFFPILVISLHSHWYGLRPQIA